MTAFTEEDRATFRRSVGESACRSVLERYSHAIDWMDWDTLEELIWPDAEFDFGMWSGNVREFLPWVKELEAGYERRLHLFCVQGISIDGAKARAEVGMANHLRLVDESDQRQDDIVFGRYQFGLECRGREWRINALRFLLHGVQRFRATDDGGSALYADGLSPSHPLFAK